MNRAHKQMRIDLERCPIKLEMCIKHKIVNEKENIMRGEIISREYQRIEWVRGEDGKEYACYGDDGQQNENHTEDRKNNCIDLSQVLGDSW